MSSTLDGGALGGGRIDPIDLEKEMKSSYLDYAMSVIVGRALPDARDGLKPVHRRVLYAMHEAGLQPNRKFVKSAQVVGKAMGEYHPHGDSAIYDTLVRMAQDFSLRYLLVHGQGNFGSVDGDPAAAMRYTECKLRPIGTEMLRDIDENTVAFGPNYDGSRREPLVLPSRFPNLLVNGSSGIAVGMATNMAPHNLGEVIDAVLAFTEDPTLTVEELSTYIKGPDFPTGAIIHGMGGIRDAYTTGRGKIVMRARAHYEELRQGRTAIVVTEIPYQVNKANLIIKIAELVRERVIDEIPQDGLRDESDRQGMRIVIELKRGANYKVVLNKLYKHTALQSTFGINNIALVDGVPKLLNLRDLIYHYVEHQRDVLTRRTKHRLDKAKARAHILEGYLIAIDNIDRVIEIIRGSRNTEAARTELMSTFELSELQSQAILDLRLSRLTQLSVDDTREEYKELLEKINELLAILRDETLLFAMLREELQELRKSYVEEGMNYDKKDRRVDVRRTEITAHEGEIDLEQMIADTPMAITITKSGYIKSTALNVFRQQNRGGVGVSGFDLKEGDYVEHMFVASKHDYLLFITSVGKIYRTKVYEIPEGARQNKGRALVNVLPLAEDEQVKAVYRTRNYDEQKYIIMATKKGVVKKTEFAAYNTKLRADGIIALNLKTDEDELIGVCLTSGDDDLLLVSANGQAVRFHEESVRSMGRTASGVKGMNVKAGDEVISIDVARDDQDLLLLTEKGYGKRVQVSDYPRKGRGTMGVITFKNIEEKGKLITALTVRDGQGVMLITSEGTITRQSVDQISRYGRPAQGVTVMKLRDGNSLVAVARVIDGDPGDAAADAQPGLDVGPAGAAVVDGIASIDIGTGGTDTQVAETVDLDEPTDE
ncbi:MAG: gyrA [Thermoleophilia bacterium]|nr:gyrA [Thermoleophilia bacterium]